MAYSLFRVFRSSRLLAAVAIASLLTFLPGVPASAQSADPKVDSGEVQTGEPQLGPAQFASAGLDICGDQELNRNDDQSTGAVPLGFEINLLGVTYDQTYVNNNGNVTFDGPLSTYTPFGLLGTSRVIIAPFFADVDTRPTVSGITSYGQTTHQGRDAFCVSWPMVGYFREKVDKLNDFGLLLVDRSDTGPGNFDIIFSYGQIQWETGGASEGSGGLGGTSARVGYATPGGAFEFGGSGVPGAFLDSDPLRGLVNGSLNSNVPGEYILPVRNGEGVDPVGQDFVYAAFGDSYASGEGAAPYEDGSPVAGIIEPENTLTEFAFGGNGCHRSLKSFAKINIGVFEPTQQSILIERSCSGAQIQPENGIPITSTNGNAGQSTQVDQALDQLDRVLDLGPDDVDLVTVSMGGNDIGFAKVVEACLLPTVLREVLAEYPDLPNDVRFGGWLGEQFGSCERIDGLIGNSRGLIAALPPIQSQAQLGLAQTFPEATLFQLTYPNAVPLEDNFIGETCGGLRADDAAYARETVQLLNDVIRSVGSDSGAASAGRYQVVDIQTAFGSNPLCPANPADALVNGIEIAKLEALIATLLDEASASRQRMDAFFDSWGSFRNCKVKEWLPRTENCDAKYAIMRANGDAVIEWFTDNTEVLIGQLVEGDSVEERFENSRGLFHPNEQGVAVVACHIRAAYFEASTAGCEPTQNPNIYLLDGAELEERDPLPFEWRDLIPFFFNGFTPDSSVRVRLFSTPRELGEFTVNADGEVEGEIEIPADLEPGVHHLVFDGMSGETSREIEVLIEIDGVPEPGTDFGIFRCCFEPGELVDLTLLGTPLGTWEAGADGSIVASIPVPFLEDGREVTVGLAGRESGITDETEVPTPPRCNDLLVTIDMNTNGGDGTGTSGDDVILGTPNADVIDAGAGNDTVCAGAGDDIIIGGDGNDMMIGGEGQDVMRGNAGTDTLEGEAGNDRLLGGIDNDIINGGDGDDFLGGFGGADTINGGPGDEVIFGGFGADIIDAGPGNDEVHGLTGNDIITGGSGNDQLDGDRGNDTINGGPGDDVLRGGNAADVLNGGAGDDDVRGGRADDQLRGGAGDNDVCIGNKHFVADTADATCESAFGIP